jgi:NADH dehydrogenase
MAITSQMIYARLAMDILQSQQNQAIRQSPLAAVAEAEKLERERGAS